MVADPQRAVPGSVMPRTLMASSTREVITRYLTGGEEGAKGAQGAQGAQGAAIDGAALYAKWCAACHGASGRGDGPNAANLPVKPAAHSSKEAMSARPDDSLFDTIAAGGKVMNRSPRMPAFGATLSGGEIRALVRHIRTLCGCEGPAWSRNP
jgi:mono/diheme cytochrome c family protein